MPPKRVSVVIADDHPLFREAMTDAVKARPDLELLASAKDGREALERIRELEPAVAVLDLRMPALDGNQVLNAVQRDGLPTRILFCATATESHVVYDCLAGGAAGYLDKGVEAGAICNAIAAVARGDTVLSDPVQGGVLGEIGRRAPTASAERLTPRELEILRLLADGLSGPQIAEKLIVAPSTVKTHLGNLYEKLGVSDRAAAVAEAMRRGLLE